MRFLNAIGGGNWWWRDEFQTVESCPNAFHDR